MRVLRSVGVCLLSVVFVVACVSVPTPATADVGISFDFFYSNLSPHGSWIVSANYGRVWQPAVYSAGWNPYYDGHWLYTDVGWTWVSDYHWGGVPYHYGTWVVDARYGWVWVPGYVWAPSWVVFSTGPDYIGWAPVPVGYSVGMSIGSSYYSPDHFVFVASRDFVAPRIRTYAVPASSTRVIINNTRIENTIRIENNVVINNGPDVRLVQKASGRRIEAESIERVPRVGPARHMSRADLRADAAAAGGRLRAAEPISERESEVIINRGRSEDRGRSQDRDPRVRARSGDSTEPNSGRPRRGPHFSPSADPQAQPGTDVRRERMDREPSRDREPSSDREQFGDRETVRDRDRVEPETPRDRGRQRDRRADEPEASPRKHGPRFSPTEDPQMQADRDARGKTMNREQSRDQGARREEVRPERQRRPDPSEDRGRMSTDDSRSKADAEARARADARAKADAKKKADTKEKAEARAKEKAKKKERPKPPPSDEKPPR